MTPVIKNLPPQRLTPNVPRRSPTAEVTAWLDERDRARQLQRIDWCVNVALAFVAGLLGVTLYNLFNH